MKPEPKVTPSKVHYPLDGCYWLDKKVGYALCGAGVDYTPCTLIFSKITCKDCKNRYCKYTDHRL